MKNWEPLPFNRPAFRRSCSPMPISTTWLSAAIRSRRLSGAGLLHPGDGGAAALILYDAAKNEQEDADYLNEQGLSKHKPALPLTTPTTCRGRSSYCGPTPREHLVLAGRTDLTRYHDVGHLLGAAMIEVELAHGSRPAAGFCFPATWAATGAPLYHDPTPPTACGLPDL